MFPCGQSRLCPSMRERPFCPGHRSICQAVTHPHEGQAYSPCKARRCSRTTANEGSRAAGACAQHPCISAT